MDIELAGEINGIRTAEILHQTSDVPIVFLTGFSHDPLLQQAKIAAPYGYLIKPVPERELAATLEYTEKKCPECGQRLRFPKTIGGMAMACPTCGNKFHSDFKLGGVRRSSHATMLTNIYEWPYRTLKRIYGFMASLKR